MVLSRSDENELLTALHDGLHESPRWRTFLDRLRRRTQADDARFAVQQGERQVLHATEPPAASPAAHRIGDIARTTSIPYERLRPNRVYTTQEIADPEDPVFAPFRAHLDSLGATYCRFLRITEPGGMGAWIAITGSRADFAAADSALLTALAPHLSIALRNFAALEQARFRVTVAEDVLGRAGIGWSAVDAEGRVIAASPLARGKLGQGGARLVTGSSESDREIARIRDAFARDGRSPPRVVAPDSHRHDGILAVPVPGQPLAAPALPVMVALIRETSPMLTTFVRARVTQALHGLNANEARLALLIASGQSLAEIAEILGLTIETTRDYSKRVYAKTSTRGQADLARLVLTGVAVLA